MTRANLYEQRDRHIGLHRVVAAPVVRSRLHRRHAPTTIKWQSTASASRATRRDLGEDERPHNGGRDGGGGDARHPNVGFRQ